MSAEFRLRVYWEDTDAGGIVYYANYLKFIERARTEALLGARDQPDRAARAARDRSSRCATWRSSYLAPARLEDQLVVTTAVGAIGGARLEMAQDIRRDETCLVEVPGDARLPRDRRAAGADARRNCARRSAGLPPA